MVLDLQAKSRSNQVNCDHLPDQEQMVVRLPVIAERAVTWTMRDGGSRGFIGVRQSSHPFLPVESRHPPTLYLTLIFL
jgi:hypothetical protein